MTTPEPKINSLYLKTLILFAALLILLAGGLYWIKAQGITPREATAPSQKQEKIADLDLLEPNGSSRKLSSFHDKILMVNFWATWCEACMIEMPSIVALREQYKERGFEVISINVDENPTAVLSKTISKYGMKFPIFIDPQGTLANLFNLQAIPLTLLLDANRKVLLSIDGEYDWNHEDFRARLERWLSPS